VALPFLRLFVNPTSKRFLAAADPASYATAAPPTNLAKSMGIKDRGGLESRLRRFDSHTTAISHNGGQVKLQVGC